MNWLNYISLRPFYYPICGDCEVCTQLDKQTQFLMLLMLTIDEE